MVVSLPLIGITALFSSVFATFAIRKLIVHIHNSATELPEYTCPVKGLMPQDLLVEELLWQDISSPYKLPTGHIFLLKKLFPSHILYIVLHYGPPRIPHPRTECFPPDSLF